MAEPYKFPPPPTEISFALPCSLWNIATKQEKPKHQVAGGKNKINGHDRELDKIHERQKRGAISIYIQGLKWTGMIENWDLHQQFFARLLLLLAAPNYLFAFASLEVHSSATCGKLQPRLDSPACLLSAHCPQTISSTPFSNNTSKTDTVYQTHLCQ